MQKPQKHNQHLEENPLEICAKYKKKKVGRKKKENEKLSLSGEGKQEGVKETKTVSIMNPANGNENRCKQVLLKAQNEVQQDTNFA